MRRSRSALVFLIIGVVLLSLGWVLAVFFGERVAQPYYRSDEDFNTLVAAGGLLLAFAGAVLTVDSLFLALRKTSTHGTKHSGGTTGPT